MQQFLRRPGNRGTDGHAVTQITNKGTTVVIPALTGTITTNNASLNDDTVVTFTVTNSLVEAGDTVVLSIASGEAGGAGDNRVAVSGVINGSFDISIKNESGGSLTDVLVINYAVLKAVLK